MTREVRNRSVPLFDFVFTVELCLIPRRLSLDENVRAKEGGKETMGSQRASYLLSVPFPCSLAVHRQSLAFRARLYDALRCENEPKPLKATSLQRSLCFVPADKKSIHWLLFKTSLQRPLSSVPWPLFSFFQKKKKYIFFKQRLPLKVKKWKIKMIKLSKQKLLPYREQYCQKKKTPSPLLPFRLPPSMVGSGWADHSVLVNVTCRCHFQEFSVVFAVLMFIIIQCSN